MQGFSLHRVQRSLLLRFRWTWLLPECLRAFGQLRVESRAPEGRDFEPVSRVMQEYPVILTMLGADKGKNEPINPGAAIINPDFRDLIPSAPGIIANIPIFEQNAVGSGIINSFPEIDGVTRRAPLVLNSGETLYPNVTMEVLRVLAGDPSFQIKLNALGVDKLRIPQYGFLQTDNLGRVWLDWSQRHTSHSALDNSIPKAGQDGAWCFV